MEPYATELFAFQSPVGLFSSPRTLIFLAPPARCGQQIATTIQLDTGVINLDVVVTPQSGAPISGLEQRDFTILDNKVPPTITSFRALRGREAPIEVIPVIDDVNTGGAHIAYERSEVDKFLRLDGGNLAHPVALAIFTDSGVKIQDEFTTDGKALSAVLDQYAIGQHSIPGSRASTVRWSASSCPL